MRRRANSGQILVIAAFIMASLLLSAQFYILEVGKNSAEMGSDSFSDFVLTVKLGSKHVVVGSLANISDGGQNSYFAWNLQQWSSFLSLQYQLGGSVLNYTLRQTPPYSSGVWLYWGANGYGVSSAYANFTYKLSGREVEVDQSYFINTTTTLLVESTYQSVLGNTKQVNVTLNLLNEAEPALARQATIYYKVLDVWMIPDATNNYVLLDYGNGTYIASFMADIPSFDVEVSAHVFDQREIYVQTNATSTQI